MRVVSLLVGPTFWGLHPLLASLPPPVRQSANVGMDVGVGVCERSRGKERLCTCAVSVCGGVCVRVFCV